jgi:hypothetical protein
VASFLLSCWDIAERYPTLYDWAPVMVFLLLLIVWLIIRIIRELILIRRLK